MNIIEDFWERIDLFFSKNELEEIAKRDITIAELNEVIDSLKAESEVRDILLKDTLKQLTDSNNALHQYIIKELQEKEAKIQEDYWNNKYPKTDITYSRIETDGTYYIDPRNYFDEHDASIPIVSGTTNDDKALNALKKVRSIVTYTDDKSSYGYGEYWAYAYQTLKRKKGDCEDGAILLANIMLRSGIPYWRIRLNAGSVNGGGHAYVTYCRETDNQFVVLDWCYWANNLPVKDRPLHRDEQNYSNKEKNFYVWFSWNSKYSFGVMDTMKGMPDEFVRL